MQQYGDIHAIVTDLQTAILGEVATRIQERTAVLLDVCSAVAEIDVLLAWSVISDECGFVRPQLAEDFVVLVKVPPPLDSHVERTPPPAGAGHRPFHPQ